MKSSKNYFKESYGELKKVTFPGKDELIKASTVVLIFTTIFSLSFVLLDNLFGAGYKAYRDATASFRTEAAAPAAEAPVSADLGSVTVTDESGNPVDVDIQPSE